MEYEERTAKTNTLYNQKGSFGPEISDAELQWFRRMGMGFLLAGVFLPFGLLAVLAVLGAGLYVCTRIAMYFHRIIRAPK